MIKSFWILASLVLSFASAAAQGVSPGTGQVSEKTIQQLQALEQSKLQRTPVEQKMSSNLLDAVAASQKKPIAEGAPTVRAMVQALPEDRVLVTVKGQITPALQQYITSQGGTGITALPQYKVLSASLPLSRVEAVAARPEVKSMDFAAKAIRNQSSALQDQEGDIAHAAAAARTQFHTTGAGVKLCVISDSVNYLAQAQTNGSLGSVQIPPGASGTNLTGYSNSGEGTAMLEIVHRIAPDAPLEFATANPAETNMAANIGVLKQDGCKVIVDDITYLDESPFQDGIIADAVTDASNAGVLYFSSAANSGNQMHGTSGTWEGDFKPSSTAFTVQGKTYTFHEFAPGVVYDTVTDASLVEGTPVATLFWDDPLGAATNEYQLAVVDANDNVISHSNTNINGNTDPFQILEIHAGDRIAILRAPSAQPRFLHLATNRAKLQIGTTGATQGHNASGAGNAFTIASKSAENQQAAFSGGPSVPADDWSSDGPRRIFYDSDGNPLTPGNLAAGGGVLLEKPDVTAADCVTTDVPGFAPFCGTSAAAPHAAAIAALVMAAHPQMTAAQIRAVLTQTSLDIETPGWDSVSGLGIVMPGPALQASATIAAEPFVDLTGPAVQARNATASTGSGMQYWPLAQGWRFVAPHARLTMSFNSAQANKPMKLVLYHCTSSIWPRAGYSPVTIALNGTVVVSNFDVARNHRGSRDYAWDSLPIRSSAVKRGTNTLTIETQPGMVTHYWLRSVRLQPV